MKKLKMKKLVSSTILSLTLVISSINIMFANDINGQENEKQITSSSSNTVTGSSGNTLTRVRTANYLVVGTDRAPEKIYTSDTIWSQPVGYASYRVHIVNTRNEILTVTSRQANGTRTSYECKANDSITLLHNGATSGQHKLSFTTSSGTVSGTVAVRVSDTPLS